MPTDLQTLLEQSGAILKGHFKLTSGRHSDTYFEKFRVLERPEVLTELCRTLADQFREQGVDLVAGPTTGGIIVAFDVARHLGVQALYVETENGEKTLRRGANIRPGTRVLVVDDVFTTGRSVLEVASLMEAHGAVMVGVGVLIDRSERPDLVPYRLVSAHRVEAKSYAENDVPDWLLRIPLTKPGTRTL